MGIRRRNQRDLQGVKRCPVVLDRPIAQPRRGAERVEHDEVAAQYRLPERDQHDDRRPHSSQRAGKYHGDFASAEVPHRALAPGRSGGRGSASGVFSHETDR